MGTEKRERQKANRAAKIEAERAAEARARRLRTIRNLVLAGVILVVGMLLISALSGCAKSEDTDQGTAATDQVSDDSGDSSSEAAGTCETSETGEPILDYTEQPSGDTDPSKTYIATFDTTEGVVKVQLDTERTPGTTDNFVALARNCYFDGTDLFRTEAQSGIIQGGSPHTQDNTDQGPGYTIQDEGLPFSSEDYAPGTIAMANTGAPNSGSAQFFFLANEGGRYLGDPAQLGESAGSYAVFGQVIEGLDVLEAIAALDDGSSAPSKQVTINSVTIDEQ